MSRLGKKVRTIRIQRGMTPKQLAKRIGVAEKYILEVEEGRRILNDVLVEKLSRVLGQNIDDYMLYEVEEKKDELQGLKGIDEIRRAAQEKFEEAYKYEEEHKKQDALAEDADYSVFNVPIYAYNLKTLLGVRPTVVVSGKINSYEKEKAVYLRIEEDIKGFRMERDDIALGFITREIENNSIYLIEYKNKRTVRQLKKLDNLHVLVTGFNKDKYITETALQRDITVLVKLEKLEITL
ncbi:MAG: helix-turn-helix transcriptional regulator [Clostridiaceae bacterium]|nr:helix-turn-helix transcriptional regulator [Clostridiaceae bacterium]